MNRIWLDAYYNLCAKNNQVMTRIGPSKEILGYHMELDDIDQNFVTVPERKLSPTYAAAELLWYLSGTDDITMIKAYAPSYENYANDGRAFGAYGHRWTSDWYFENQCAIAHNGWASQLFAAIECLRKDKDSRQAVISQWNGGDICHAILKDKKDLPCTLTIQFIVRGQELNMFVNMRSNDCWLGFPYDVYCFTSIQQMVAWELDLFVGTYFHSAASEHLYEKHYDKNLTLTPDVGHGYPNFVLPDGESSFTPPIVNQALACEEKLRLCKHIHWNEIVAIPNPILRDAVVLCGLKWLHLPQGWTNDLLTSNIFRSMYASK